MFIGHLHTIFREISIQVLFSFSNQVIWIIWIAHLTYIFLSLKSIIVSLICKRHPHLRSSHFIDNWRLGSQLKSYWKWQVHKQRFQMFHKYCNVDMHKMHWEQVLLKGKSRKSFFTKKMTFGLDLSCTVRKEKAFSEEVTALVNISACPSAPLHPNQPHWSSCLQTQS